MMSQARIQEFIDMLQTRNACLVVTKSSKMRAESGKKGPVLRKLMVPAGGIEPKPKLKTLNLLISRNAEDARNAQNLEFECAADTRNRVVALGFSPPKLLCIMRGAKARRESSFLPNLTVNRATADVFNADSGACLPVAANGPTPQSCLRKL
jgi:hypothetical protein